MAGLVASGDSPTTGYYYICTRYAAAKTREVSDPTGVVGLVPLQHLRQILAPRTASIVHVVCSLLRTLGRQFIEPINELGITAALLNETAQAVTTIAPALVAGDAQHIEFADEIAEDGCAVAGHHMLPDGLILGCTVLFQ